MGIFSGTVQASFLKKVAWIFFGNDGYSFPKNLFSFTKKSHQNNRSLANRMIFSAIRLLDIISLTRLDFCSKITLAHYPDFWNLWSSSRDLSHWWRHVICVMWRIAWPTNVISWFLWWFFVRNDAFEYSRNEAKRS